MPYWYGNVKLIQAIVLMVIRIGETEKAYGEIHVLLKQNNRIAMSLQVVQVIHPIKIFEDVSGYLN